MSRSTVAGRPGSDSAPVDPEAWPAPRPARPRAGRRTAVLLLLAWTEGRALLRHPVLLGGLAVTVLSLAFVPSGAGTAFSFVTGGGAGGLWLPPSVFFAANLCASRDRRSATAELNGTAPVTRAARTAAQCGAALVPAAVVALVVVSGAIRFRVLGVLAPPASPVELTLLPLSVLGGGVLGVMVARWLPWRGAPVLVFAGLVAISVALSNGAAAWWISYVELLEWEGHALTERRMAGSAAWHAAYLVGLAAMAAIGALLRDATRRAPLLLVGAVVTLATAGAGTAQLP